MTKKELIFEAGAKLFAQGSFNSVGIRDIANEAGVNSAMISYYYGGKVGLLREIFIKFSSLLRHEQEVALEESNSMHELCSVFTKRIHANARANYDIYTVGLRELNHDSKELQDLRIQADKDCWDSFFRYVGKLGIRKIKEEDFEVEGLRFTAVLGLIFSDHLLGGSICSKDDAMAELYTDIIIDILQRGLPQHWA